MKSGVLKKWSARRVSRTVFYALLAVVAVVFGLFYTVGYARPFEDNPEYNAPMFSGLVVGFTLSFVVIAAVILLAVAVLGAKRRRRERLTAGDPRSSRIAMAVAAATLLTLAVTFALGSSSALVINGADYNDTFWLKAADMFVYTIAVMLLLAVAAAAFGKASRRSSSEEVSGRGRAQASGKARTSDRQETGGPGRGGKKAGGEMN